MKKVFSSDMVCHVWSQQNQAEGRTSNGTLFFDGATIYSYNAGHPIGLFFQDDVVLLVNDTYSPTTSGHCSQVRNSLFGKSLMTIEVPTSVLRDFPWFNKSAPERIEKNYYILKNVSLPKFNAWVLNAMQEAINSAAKRKSATLQAHDLARAGAIFLNGSKFWTQFGFDVPSECSNLRDLIILDQAGLLASRGAELKAERKQQLYNQKHAAELYEVDYQNGVTKWLDGSLDRFPGYHKYKGQDAETLLRFVAVKDEIQTSRGAVFPASHARRAYPHIKNCKVTGVPFITNSKSIHLGNFTIDSISEVGDVKAGCHFVTWREIHKIALQLGFPD